MAEKLFRRVIFDLNDGTSTKRMIKCPAYEPLKSMPIPKRDNYDFLGWFTAPELNAGMEYTKDMDVTRSMTLYAHWKEVNVRRRSLFMRASFQDNWENDSRDQANIGLGSEGYKEYAADLKDNDPMIPDDPMHNALEERNAQLALELAEKAGSEGTDASKERLKRRLRKESMVGAIYAATMAKAKGTPDVSDDRRAAALNLDGLINDDSVTEAGLQDAADTVVFNNKYF